MPLTLALEANNNTQNTASLAADGSGVLINVIGLSTVDLTFDYTKGTETALDITFNVVFKNNPTKSFQLLSSLATASPLLVSPTATGRFTVPITLPFGAHTLYSVVTATGTPTGTVISGVSSNGSATQNPPNNAFMQIL